MNRILRLSWHCFFLFLCLLQISAQPVAPPEPTEAAVLQAVARGVLQGRVEPNTLLAAPTIPMVLPGLLSFASNRGGVFDLYEQAGVGETAVSLITSSSDDSTPVWSPDGRQMLFASNRDGDYDIYLYEASSGSIQNVTNSSTNDIHPAWHPNGQSILFASDRGGSFFQIYRSHIDGSGLAQVGVVPNNNAVFPRYAPDGSRISYMRASILTVACDWNWDVWLMDSSGGSQQRVSSGLLGDVFPTWSPDGTRLLYASCGWTLAADLIWHDLGSGATGNLTPNTSWSSEWHGVYGGDGVTLAYVSDRTGSTDIWVQDGSGMVQNLTNHAGDDLAPAWRPTATGGTLSGQVTAFGGRPLANVAVSNGAGATATTDEGGFYRFVGVGNGRYTLTPQHPGYQFDPAQRTVDVPPAGVGQNFVGKNCSQANVDNVPVLLVTGWSGSESSSLAVDDQLSYFIEWMGDKGYVEGCNLFYAADTTPRERLAVNGAIIQANLCDYADDVAAFKGDWDGAFHIVAHSYGGLRARAYLEDGELNGRCPRSSQTIQVNTLITMGTPHGGALPDLPLSAVIGTMALLRGSEWPAIWEMLPPVRLWQNVLAQQPANTCYHLLGGDARTQWPVFLTTLALYYYTGYGASVLAEGNDLAVWLDSAHQLAEVGFSLNYPRTTTLTTPDVHGQILDLTVLRSYVNPGTTFDEEIWPLLNGSTGCQNQQRLSAQAATALAEQRWQTMATLARPLTGAGVPLLDVAGGTLAAGQVAEGTFELGSSGTAAVTLHWSAGEMGLTLVDPTGRVIDPQTAVTDTTLDYGQFNGGLGLLASYVVRQPVAGTWRYQIVRQSGGETAVYRLVVLTSTPVAVSSSVPQWLPANSMVPVVAAVQYENREPVLGSLVVANVQPPDGSQFSLTLLDDGNHGDGAANDGVYGGHYGPAAGGGHGVLVRARGSYAGEPYERTATAVFTIAPPKASLNGSQRDEGVREGELLTKLAVDVGVAVAEGSRLTLAADLYAGETFVTHTTATAVLAPGERAIRLLFDGRAIRERGLDGPYTVRHLLLLDNEPALLLVEQVEMGGETAVYRHDEFGRLWHTYLPLIGND